MAIVLLYNFRIVLVGRDSVSAGRDLPFRFDKSQNLLFSIVFDLSFFIVFYRIWALKWFTMTITMTINLSKIIVVLSF